jgi:O-antigen biosynthesis protein WbqP
LFFIGFKLSMNRYLPLKRLIDLSLAYCALLTLFIPMLLIALAIKLTSKGPVLHWSRRVGRYNTFFMMPKFRSMHLNTPDVATHLLNDPHQHLTTVGRILRLTSMDELPQLYSIIRGEMSFVGPRPALYNQNDLINMRTAKGVHRLDVGLTGWAQINGRDNIPMERKVELDTIYLRKRGLQFDMKILWATFVKAIRKVGVAH